ncbi:uncharacterized protein [Apostichopus japonicus]|uniref:uncharacterized protein n=1 Tax=Stichopus japonicus TaxID=307972 RepID=UPI003AB91107
MLMELKNEQKAMHRQMRKFGMLLAAIRDEGIRTNTYEPPEDIKLPADTVEDLDRLEESLAVDGDLEKYLINHLFLIGGTNLRECVRSMLSAIFTNKVGRMVNWMGGGQMQKKCFQSTKIRDVLQSAIRKKPSHIISQQCGHPEMCNQISEKVPHIGQGVGGRCLRWESRPNLRWIQTIQL